jgi:hypothetical protein
MSVLIKLSRLTMHKSLSFFTQQNTKNQIPEVVICLRINSKKYQKAEMHSGRIDRETDLTQKRS